MVGDAYLALTTMCCSMFAHNGSFVRRWAMCDLLACISKRGKGGVFLRKTRALRSWGSAQQ
eukprot:5487824-Pyramimonas_sp.AAC.1